MTEALELVSSISHPENPSDEFMAAWTAEAACRGDRRPNVLGGIGGFAEGFVWDKAFHDEGVDLNDRTVETHLWSSTVLEVMQVCGGCPVRRDCLRAAYDEEQAMSRRWYSSELEDDDRRYGIRGGLPGRVREVFGDRADRIEASDAWFERKASRYGFGVSEDETIAL